MIVTCERCTTQFQLDDARIPPGGVRVRCSRCRHAFEVVLPTADATASGGASPDDTLPDLPPDAPPQDEPWGGNDELDGGPLTDERVGAEASGFAGRSALSEPAGRSFLDQDEESSLLGDGPADDEESDWEFNEEPPATGAPDAGDDSDAANVVDQFLRSPRSAAAGADATPDEALGVAPSGLDLADPLSEPADEPDAAEADLPAVRAPMPKRESVVPDSILWPEAAPGKAAGDELGAADDWDLFGGESHGRSGVRVPVVRLPAPVAAEDDPIDRRRGSAWASRIGGLVGWVAVSVLFALGVLDGLAPADRAFLPVPAGTHGDLEIVEASGVWIDNAVAGSIYVISGRLLNAGSSQVAAPALAIELLDGEGRIVADLPVPLESPHSRRNLRELAPAELAHGPPLATGHAIGPGDSVPFQAVVGDVPPRAASYRVVDAPASLRRSRPPASGSERPGEPKRKRRDSAFEMIAEHETEEDAGPPASGPLVSELPADSTPAAPAR